MIKDNIDHTLKKLNIKAISIEEAKSELLDLYFVSNREPIESVIETLYDYKIYVMKDNSKNLEEKQKECYRIMPLIRNLMELINDC